MIDRQKFEKTYVLEGQGTIAEWGAELDRVATLQARFRRRIVTIRVAAFAVFLACVALRILEIAPQVPFMLIGIVGAIVLLGYSIVKGTKGIIVDRVEYLRRLLALLQEDSEASHRFQVTLHLQADRRKISEGKIPHASSGKQILLQDSWLTLAGRLRDRTTMSHSVVDLIRQRIKKNMRGKTKTKERQVCLLRIRLAYKAETYGDAGATALRLKKAINLPANAITKSFQFGESAMNVKTLVKGSALSGDLFAATQAVMLGSYRILNLSRRLARPAGKSK